MSGIPGSSDYVSKKEFIEVARLVNTGNSSDSLKAFAKSITSDPSINLDLPILKEIARDGLKINRFNQAPLLKELKVLLSNRQACKVITKKGYGKALLKGLNFRVRRSLFSSSKAIATKRLFTMVCTGICFKAVNPGKELNVNDASYEIALHKAMKRDRGYTCMNFFIFKRHLPLIETNGFHQCGRTKQPTLQTEDKIHSLRDGDLLVRTNPPCTSFFDAVDVRAKIRIGDKVYSVKSLGVKEEKGRLIIKGRGAFGRVLVGKDQDGNRIAIKITTTKSTSHAIGIERECDIVEQSEEALLQMDLGKTSDRILSCSAVGEKDGSIFSVMPVQRGGELLDHIGKASQRTMDSILYDAAVGIRDMHQQGYIHRDIKPANILCDGKPPKGSVADFGLTCKSTRKIGRSGTPRYMPPEAHDRAIVSKKFDVFSLGATLYHTWLGILHPIVVTPSRSLVHDLTNIKWDLIGKKIGVERMQLIKACMSRHPEDRPDMDKVVEKLRQIKDLKGKRTSA